MDAIPPRYEHKFALSPALAARVRDAIVPYCTLDEHAIDGVGYAVNSLYLDGPGFPFYRATELKQRTRFKLRVRGYDDASAPVALEVKHKVGDVVVKRRAFLPRDGWVERVRGGPPADATDEEKDFFARLVRFVAAPVALVRYQREPWASVVDGYARVTFDRRLQAQRADDWTLAGDAAAWETIDDGEALGDDGTSHVLLELKHGEDVPRWMRDVVRRFDLEPVGYSKYGTAAARFYGRVERFDASSRIARW
jgi:hypothetical protein